MIKRPRRLLLASFVAALMAASLVAGYVYYIQASKVQLRIFASSSLTNLFKEYELRFEGRHNVDVVLNLASSNALREQIVEDLPCDVFASASTAEMDLLRSRGLIFQNRSRVFAYNYIAIAMPADNPAHLQTIEDLSKKGVRIVLADFKTPLGNYTSQVLSKIESSWGDRESAYYQNPAVEKYRAKVLANVVAYEANAQQVVTKVMAGLADAGFVYFSDVAVRGVKLQAISIPPELNVKASYQIAVLNDAPQLRLALAFVDYVFSEEGLQVMRKWGFTDVEGSGS
ncbi:molybdate ABC transporter substrate-binding protein [Candidatus Bathyarchaeota archaeon]|nr:molybdate ABC transporter substrate-binding protein [Candidatus Bathyarchaeota archaeon]